MDRRWLKSNVLVDEDEGKGAVGEETPEWIVKALKVSFLSSDFSPMV